MMHNDNAQERDVERRLGRLDSPEPPADLLDRIRADIPDYLRPVDKPEAATAPRRRRYRLLAASVFLLVAGGVLAYRVFQEAPAPLELGASEAREDAAPTTPRPATTEVGVDAERAVDEAPASPPAATSVPAQTAPAQSQDAAEARAERAAEPPADKSPAAVREETEPVRARQEPRAERITPPAFIAPRDESPASSGTQLPAERPATQMTQTAPLAEAVAGRATRRTAVEEQLKAIEVGAPMPPSPAPAPSIGDSAGPSTGGIAEPNDQPWGDMFFRPYGTNPFVDTEDDPLSTFGLDVDTGSYTLARGYLERGHLPPAEAIRVEEFVNFFDYRDPPPRRGEFTLTVEGAPSPWRRGPRYQLLRIGLHGREISAAQRRDATLVFVVDVSGSMGRGNRLGLVQQALRLLLDQLGPGDRVGLVVYGSRGSVLLEPSGDLQAVRRAIDRLTPGGSTNAEEGLVLGYELARRHFRPESINRLMLCSDGVANVGRTGPESILARVEREAGDGIELTTVGFGMGNYNDVLMEQLADRGDGNYAYVDTLDEARRIFVENLTGTLQTIASDAKIQVEFDPEVVSRYRLLGYENRDVADHRFRDDTVDAGEIGAGHRVTALYEIKLADEASRRGELAEVRLRYRSRQTGRVVEDSLQVRRSELERSWQAASPTLRLAALAAELAEVLKRSYWSRETRPEELRERAREVRREFPGDRDVAQLVELVDEAARLIERADPPSG